jgi:hypothetical protein|nr:MAG TPA: RecR protein [Caudoviricetes sp.]
MARSLKRLKRPDMPWIDEISPCPSCFCLTKTYENGTCAKCHFIKDKTLYAKWTAEQARLKKAEEDRKNNQLKLY